MPIGHLAIMQNNTDLLSIVIFWTNMLDFDQNVFFYEKTAFDNYVCRMLTTYWGHNELNSQYHQMFTVKSLI